MIEYENFSMGLKFKKSNAEIGKDFAFKGLDILENANQVPYFELGLESNYITSLQDETDIELEYQSEELNYTCPLGINSMVFDGKSVLIKGWLTEWENFKVTNTRYLGEDTDSALKKLEIREKINSDDNLTGPIFQINQSNILQCLDICASSAKYPYWSIGRHSINLSESLEDSKVELRTGGQLIINTINEDINQENIGNYEDYFKDTPKEWMNYGAFLDRYLISFSEQKDQLKRLLMNKKFMDIGLKYYLTADVPYEYEFPVGTKFKSKNDLYPIDTWVVISEYYHYRRNAVFTNILYGGLG